MRRASVSRPSSEGRAKERRRVLEASRLSASTTAAVVIAAVIVRDPFAHETIMLRHLSRVNVVFDLDGHDLSFL
jgi:hypothetical protein